MNNIEKNKEIENVNPELTQSLIKNVKEKANEGVYRVEVKFGEKLIPIDVYPEIFPPKSDYSISSKSVFETFGNLEGYEVADVGCGSGAESIVASIAGAKHVDASDIEKVAVECTKHNIELNNLKDKINVYEGDLFKALPNKKYDLIIVNLPIVNYDPENKSTITTALYDPGYELHKRTFAEAKEYLKENGVLTFTHANLQSVKTNKPDKDFYDIEEMLEEYGYKIVSKTESNDLGYKWINYKITLKDNK